MAHSAREPHRSGRARGASSTPRGRALAGLACAAALAVLGARLAGSRWGDARAASTPSARPRELAGDRGRAPEPALLARLEQPAARREERPRPVPERSALPSPASSASLALRVVDRDGRPLAGARVALAAQAPSAGVPTWAGATTDLDGRARFVDAPRGSELWLSIGDGEGVLPRVRAIAALTSGEQRDLGTLALDGCELAGVVLAPDGAPLAGARIELGVAPTAFDEEHGLAPLVRESRAVLASDASGSFRVRGIPAGELSLAVDHPLGGLRETVALPRAGELVLRLAAAGRASVLVLDERGEPLPEASVALVDGRPRSLAGARRALLERGVAVDGRGVAQVARAGASPAAHLVCAAPEHALVVLPLASPEAEVRLPLEAPLRGRLLDADRAPLPGATLRVERAGAGTASQLAVEARATTDAQGAFVLGGLCEGSYRIALEDAPRARDLGLHELRAGGEPLELVLADACLELFVCDEAGLAIAGARLVWEGADDRAAGGDAQRTDPTGRARVPRSPAPRSLVVRASGFAPASLLVRPAERRREVRLARSGALAVRVVDGERRPLPGTTLALCAPGGERPPAEARADELGLATWPDLAPGRYTLLTREARGPWEEAARPLSRVLAPGSRLELEILAGERLDVAFELAREATVRVRVTSAGLPLEGARVALGSAGPVEVAWRLDTRSECAITDRSGWAVLPARDPGNALLAVRAAAGEPAQAQALELPPGASIVEVELPGGSVTGTVVDGAGAPVPRGLARLVPETFAGASRTRILVLGDDPARGPESVHPGEARARLERDGGFRFERVPPGRYRILLESPDWAPREGEPFAVERDERLDLSELALDPRCEVTGVLQGVGSAPEAERDPVVLRLCTPDGRPVDRLALSADGPFRFAGVAPGRYRIDVERALALRAGEPFEVLPGAETFRAIDLP